MPEGIDRAAPFRSGDVLDCLKANGITFIGRYYKPRRYDGSISSYVLTTKEAQLISSKGLYIVAVYQDHGRRSSHFTYAIGGNDYSQAMERAAEIGQPTDSPIYFAVDYDAAGSGTLDSVYSYFRGILDRKLRSEALGNRTWPVGVYGSADVVYNVAQRFPEIAYKWQTAAWSRGAVTDYNLYQYEIDVRFEGCPKAGRIDRVRSNGRGGGFRLMHE